LVAGDLFNFFALFMITMCFLVALPSLRAQSPARREVFHNLAIDSANRMLLRRVGDFTVAVADQ
jgi:hypothetical protein